MTGACVRDCTVLAAAGLLASTRKSYNRAKSESALLGVSLDIENYCTLRPFFVLPGRGKGDRSR